MISVIIPIYNTSSHLKDCLDSLKKQTLQNWEAILVDDGSTDESASICQEYIDSDSRMHYFYETNSGPLIARRLGAKHASGEFLMFLDSDDMLAPTAIEAIQNGLVENDVDIAAFSFCRLSSSGRRRPSNYTFSLKPGLYVGEEYKEVEKAVASGDLVSLCLKACRKSLFDLDQGYDKWEGMKYGEDWFQVIPLVDKASSLLFMADELYVYRENHSSTSFTYSDTKIKDMQNVFDRMICYASKWDHGCELITYRTCCQKAALLLTAVSKSKSSIRRKKECCKAIRSLITSICGDDISELMPSLNIRIRFFVYLLLKKRYTTALIGAYLKESLFRLYHLVRHGNC